MNKEDNNISKCKICGQITKFMYPVASFFFCEDHSEHPMFGNLCCSNCFERYIPNYPERAAMHGEWSGHCGGMGCACHEYHDSLKENEWRKKEIGRASCRERG